MNEQISVNNVLTFLGLPRGESFVKNHVAFLGMSYVTGLLQNVIRSPLHPDCPIHGRVTTQDSSKSL